MTKWEKVRYEEAKKAYSAFIKLYPFTLENLEGEEWKPVLGYEDYHVSTYGRVKSFKRKEPYIMKPLINTHGYLYVMLWKNSDSKIFTIHRIVALTFIKNCNNLPVIDHRYGMRLDNFVENLRWASYAENTTFAFEQGLMHSAQGEKRTDAKLTNAQAFYIRENPDKMLGTELAAKFSISETTVHAIQTGKSYKVAGGLSRAPVSKKIPNELREQIRREYIKDSKEFNSYSLGKKYGVSKTTILNILKEVT